MVRGVASEFSRQTLFSSDYLSSGLTAGFRHDSGADAVVNDGGSGVRAGNWYEARRNITNNS